MQTRAALLGAATAGAIALFGVAGAASPQAATREQAAPQPRPAATSVVGPDLSALSGMIRALDTTSHDVRMRTSVSTVSGSVSPANSAAAAIAQSNGLEISEIVDRGNVYVEASLGADVDKQLGIKPGTWMKLDPAQISTDNQLLLQPDGSDPVDMHGIMTGMTSLDQPDATHLRGTIDLTRVTGHTLPDPDEVAKGGAAATNVPFTVTADPHGRITEFTVDASGFDPGLSLDVVYSNYGAGVPVVDPATSVPAPQNLYSLFNN